MNLFDQHTAEERGDEAYVRVVVERGLKGSVGVEGLTYRGDNLAVGQWVEVPLGAKARVVGGVVVAAGGRELLDGLDPDRVKTVIHSGRCVLSEPLVELAQWIARYYFCPLGVVIKAMLPGSVKGEVGVRTRMLVHRTALEATEESIAELSPKSRAALAAVCALPASRFPLEARALASLTQCTNVGPINRLIKAGFLELSEHRKVSASDQRWMTFDRTSAPPPKATDAQQRVIDGVIATLGSHAVHLLRGVTGSGKTEVYLRLVAAALARGQSAIVLVPEIALTPQTVHRFVDRFGMSELSVMHSQLSGAQRHQAWARCADGTARVLIGPRSAVFAPMKNLGVIVVDEEHDSSYKQDSSPRYHGRDVAIKRSQLEGAVVVLGSATPALESWHNASGASARYQLHTLSERASGGSLPPVQIVDFAAERRVLSRASHGPTIDLIGQTMERALRETLDREAQAILLLNRRGEAGYVACASRTCGWSMRCSSCDVSLTAHRLLKGVGSRYLRCHHCDAAQVTPAACPSCSGAMILLQPGTQHVEKELADRLGLEPGVDFMRVDSDSMRSSGSYFDLLERFGSGEIRVLLGTQMIAKGLDFPNVGLVGVLNADTTLFMPDFRAQERTFQLVCQVAGRAGRGDEATFGRARVLVQTMCPDDPAIRFAAAHDYESFARHELCVRRSARQPPVTRLSRVVARHTSLDRARALADAAFSAIKQHAEEGVEIIGPMPCAIARLSDRYRFEVRVYAPSARTLTRVLSAARRTRDFSSDADYAVDVDPLWLL